VRVTADELQALMASRRSVRRFRAEAPPRETIESLLRAAVTAPSASNKQPWRFVVIERRATIDAMAAAVREEVERIARHVPPESEAAFRAYGDYFTRFEAAPVVVVPLHRGPPVLSNLVDAAYDAAAIATMERDNGLIGSSLALANLLLMAHARGLGASGMTGPLVAAGRLREILEVPATWGILALVPIGYPAEEPVVTDRKPVEKMVRWV
jgi:nitroreductase